MPESPLVFHHVDEILAPTTRSRLWASACDGPQKALSRLCGRRAVSELGAEEHWSSLLVLEGSSMLAGGQSVPRERTLNFVGREWEPSGLSKASSSHRLLNADSIFANWKPSLTSPDTPMSAQTPAWTVSVVNSLFFGSPDVGRSPLQGSPTWLHGRRASFLSCVEDGGS